ncbi:hypothetical protein TNCV_2784351 [Trichonephila clavipes]|nr:hypothetical protein TNCV_2784351 [Trichonephila clavipes]
MQVSSGTQNNPPLPSEQSCTTKTVLYNDVLLRVTGAWYSLYESLARIRLQAKPGLVGEKREKTSHKPYVAVSTMHGLYSRLTAGGSELQTNPPLTSTEVGFKLGIHQTTALYYIKKLGFMSKLSVWVQYELNEKNLLDRMLICSSNLARPKREPFLDHLVTGDEK